MGRVVHGRERSRASQATVVLGFLLAPPLTACSGGAGAGAAVATEATPLSVPARPSDPCDVPPPSEALVPARNQGDTMILPGGRRLTPVGTQVAVGGFPADVKVHPTLRVAYVVNTGYTSDHRSVQVVSLDTGALLQEVVRADSFYGLALSPDGKRLYAAGGFSSLVDVYDVTPDGRLAAHAQISVDKYPAGLAVSKDGTRLWVGQFKAKALNATGVVEIDTTTLAVRRTYVLPFGAFNLVEVPEKDEVYVAGYASDTVAVLNVNPVIPILLPVALVKVGSDPLGLARSARGDRVFVTSANSDALVAIDTATHAVVARQLVGEATIAGEDGRPLPASSPTGLTLDPVTNSLLLARSADNAVDVFDATTLVRKGAIPVGWYPTGVAVSPAGRVVATNGKGFGVGPIDTNDGDGGKQRMTGSVSVFDLGGLDLPALAVQVEKNVRRPDVVYPFSCDRPFPVPTRPGEKSPIEHVVLIVRENKTYDSLLGDLGSGNGSARLALWGEEITPNLHKLARTFLNHDNFYDDSETSVQGHMWLTSGFTNDYIERTWFEDYRGHPDWGADPVAAESRPSWLTFFAHLIKHKVDFKVYGEIVGALDVVDGKPVGLEHSDLSYPGGPFFNNDTKDADKATYVAKKLIDEGKFPPFVYVLLPNDHTKGYTPGALTPNAMINDNDYATGLLIDRLSHSPYWGKTAVFVVEDDPQGGADHVDYHRSICVVASPWVKHGHVSSVHASYPSIFRTMEKILGVPPMNRYDALATPLWDAFTTVPDVTPYEAVERTVPDAVNPKATALAQYSAAMDFSGPDKNPDLPALLHWGRTGVLPRGSRLQVLSPADLKDERERMGARGDGDGDDDAAHERAVRILQRWIQAHPEVKVEGAEKIRAAADDDDD